MNDSERLDFMIRWQAAIMPVRDIVNGTLICVGYECVIDDGFGTEYCASSDTFSTPREAIDALMESYSAPS